MSDSLSRLGTRAQRGSKPRCHRVTEGTRTEVAARLTSLAAPWATVISTDRWMPEGFDACIEAQLHRAPQLVHATVRRALAEWWLPAGRHDATVPNFDIASTCMIGGAPGLLLVEAKAHDTELTAEARGRPLNDDASHDRKASHVTIGRAIDDARRSLSADTGLAWGISRDSHYQLSNRFAWAWKLTQLGIPVVLIYPGLLNCTEMADRGDPFVAHDEWRDLVLDEAKGVIPEEVWERPRKTSGAQLIPLIRSADYPFDGAIASMTF